MPEGGSSCARQGKFCGIRVNPRKDRFGHWGCLSTASANKCFCAYSCRGIMIPHSFLHLRTTGLSLNFLLISVDSRSMRQYRRRFARFTQGE